MAATVTKLSGPTIMDGGVGSQYNFSILFDDSYPTGGEAIDLTDYFSYISYATVNSVDAAADAGYKFTVQIPSSGTAITSSNVLVLAHYSGTADAVLNQVANTTDLSNIGELTITVVGKAAVSTTW